MRWIIHATPDTYRELILDEHNQGRLPLAWLTFGYLNGHGWGFLHPWAQLAVFPNKGRRGFVERDSIHEPFVLLRYWPTWRTEQHRNHEDPIEGRYCRGLVWRRQWGWRPRQVLLDYDQITVDEEYGRRR